MNATLTQIPLKQLSVSSLNPRKFIDKEALQELTVSIRDKGIETPLIVRPAAKFEALSRDGKYEVLAGSRRLEAAKFLKMETVPCIVRDGLNDSDACDLALVDNLIRMDMHAMDECDAYHKMAGSRPLEKKLYEEIAGRVGKSTKYVANRIQLATLIKPMREAFMKRELNLGDALLIAKLQGDDQNKLLAELSLFKWSMDVGQWINRNVIHDLSRACFDRGDATLIPKAGSCVTCPKRTGANKLLFDDAASDDICTDPACFAAKEDAHIVKVIAALEKSKTPFVKISSRWGDTPKGVLQQEQVNNAKVGGKCADTKAGVLVLASDNNRQSLGKVETVCTNLKCKIHGRSFSSNGHERAQATPAEKAKRKREAIDAKVRVLAIENIASLADRIDRIHLEMIAEFLFDKDGYMLPHNFCERHGWKWNRAQDYDNKNKRKVIQDLSANDLNRLIVELLVAKHYKEGSKQLDALIDHHKIDMKALRAIATAPKEEKPKPKSKAKSK